ncbi:MAG: glycerol-3-phosphate dehydrogenase/oxidase [Planctomycetota bacterium]
MNPATRSSSLDALADEAFDVLIVGGGIVGAGVARDAALRGMRTALVDQHDFAYGTSSRSSRLLHGGLRYLAQGRIGLVREASREKVILGRIAPHLCQPLAFVFPTYRGTPWPRWQLSVGVKLYDLLCGGQNFGASRTLGRAITAELLPGIREDGLNGAVRYYDALTNDARLVLDTIRSAAAAGAVVVNYARLDQATREEEWWRCRLSNLPLDRSVTAKARVIVNAGGPWANRLPQSGVRLRLTKGVHLVIKHERLPVPDAVVMAEGRRILFAIPWGRHVILGTTDTDFRGEPESVRTEPDDVRYILDVARAVFPAISLNEGDVLSTWAGLRPLVATGRGGPSDISRAHEIRSPVPGWIDVAGGKLTTYRLIAEQTVDRALRHLGTAAERCTTHERPLLPADAVEGMSGIEAPPPSRQLVEHFCLNEWAMHLDDVMLRRAGWQYDRGAAQRESLGREVVHWMGDALGWSDEYREAEVARYLALPM